MFKNLTLYSFDRTWNLTTAQVEAGIAQARFLACGATAEQSAGWSEPRGIAHAVLAESVGDWLIARYTTETKVLPANVVRRAADERAAKLEAQLGLAEIDHSLADSREATAFNGELADLDRGGAGIEGDKQLLAHEMAPVPGT